MSWLIGIICVILVIIFWRIFLPLGILVVVVIGIFILVMQYNDNQREEKKKRAEVKLQGKITQARTNATPDNKQWGNLHSKDPSTNTLIARTARIESNDSLCSLTVQKRLNGAELTGIDCPDFKISEWEDVEVKFSHEAISKKMDIKSYSDSSGIYIPSYQSEYSGYLSYNDFIANLKKGQSVAIKLPTSGGIWETFTLNGSSEAINNLGRPSMEIARERAKKKNAN